MRFPPRVFGLIGTGVIGSGWAVRALSRGLDVVAWDPAARRIAARFEGCRSTGPGRLPSSLGLYPGRQAGSGRGSSDSPEASVRIVADFVQESAPGG